MQHRSLSLPLLSFPVDYSALGTRTCSPRPPSSLLVYLKTWQRTLITKHPARRVAKSTPASNFKFNLTIQSILLSKQSSLWCSTPATLQKASYTSSQLLLLWCSTRVQLAAVASSLHQYWMHSDWLINTEASFWFELVITDNTHAHLKAPRSYIPQGEPR